MKYVIWILVIALLVAHQDFWYWEDDSTVFGFLPIGLFYHACLSVAASIVWLVACTLAWPQEFDKGLDEFEQDDAKVAPTSQGERQ